MDDLSVDELKQLVIFYKQKSADLEFSLLQNQLKLGRIASVKNSEEPKQAIKTVIDKRIKSDL
jgi:hypothetical protein